MIRCRTARTRLEAALERELPLEQRFELEEHVAACPSCAAEQRRARALQELLEGPGDPAPSAPDLPAAARAVFAALERGEGRPWQPPQRRPARRILVGALALAAAALLLVFVRARLARSPAPQAEAQLEAQLAEGQAAPAAPIAASGEWDAAQVEVTVRAALLAHFATSGADPAALPAFLQRTQPAARAGWPVRRFVEGLLESRDPVVARAAVRCLGALGESGAVPALERALARAELALLALEVLGDLGEPALGALERALDGSAHGQHALLQLCRIGGPRVALVLERAARGAGEDAVPSREALLDALTTAGPSAVASLLRLAAEREREPGAAGAILARLPLVRAAGPELVRCLGRERVSLELACQALALLQPSEGLAWLEERCASHRERTLALAALERFDGPAPLGAALRLARGGRVPREDVLALLDGLLERDAARAEPYTLTLLAEPGDARAARAWLALLIESEHPGVASALVRLAFSPALGDDDRQWAALAVGELGTRVEGELLVAELLAHAPSERRLAAAALLSVHTLLGADGVERALASCSAGSLRRVLTVLEDGERMRGAVSLHRLARVLDGALAELVRADPSRKETL